MSVGVGMVMGKGIHGSPGMLYTLAISGRRNRNSNRFRIKQRFEKLCDVLCNVANIRRSNRSKLNKFE